MREEKKNQNKQTKKQIIDIINETDNNTLHQRDRMQQSRLKKNNINSSNNHNNNQINNLTRSQTNDR